MKIDINNKEELVKVVKDYEVVVNTVGLFYKYYGYVRLFTRRLRDVTSKLPNVVESIRREIRCESAVLDSEAIAVGPDGRPIPF